MNIGDLVHIHSSYNHTDESGVKHSSVYVDISTNWNVGIVQNARPKFLVPLHTPGILVDITVDPVRPRKDFRWAKVVFPQGTGYVSLALLKAV